MKNQKIEREIIIDTEQAQERRVAVVEDKQLEEYYIERDEQHRHMGSVYKGRVENIIPAINAAFIGNTTGEISRTSTSSSIRPMSGP